MTNNDVVGRVLAGHPIRSDNERQQVAQAVADYENRHALTQAEQDEVVSYNAGWEDARERQEPSPDSHPDPEAYDEGYHQSRDDIATANRWASGEYGCGPTEPAPPAPLSSEQLRQLAHDQGRWMSGAFGSTLTAQQLRSLAQIREAEERAEAGIEPPISWCGLGYEKYQNDLEAAQRLWNNKKGQTDEQTLD